jgi:hypothetical protein
MGPGEYAAFFPESRKGWALGLNAGGGNIGVPVIQLVGLASSPPQARTRPGSCPASTSR